MTASAAGVCPSCAGVWLRCLTFDHTNSCPLRALDDGTAVADRERVTWAGNPFLRAATATEQTLASALGMPAPPAGAAAVTLVTLDGPATYSRVLRAGEAGTPFDPDNPTGRLQQT